MTSNCVARGNEWGTAGNGVAEEAWLSGFCFWLKYIAQKEMAQKF